MNTLRFTMTTGTQRSFAGKRTSASEGKRAMRFRATVASSVAALSNLRILICSILFSVSSLYTRDWLNALAILGYVFYKRKRTIRRERGGDKVIVSRSYSAGSHYHVVVFTHSSNSFDDFTLIVCDDFNSLQFDAQFEAVLCYTVTLVARTDERGQRGKTGEKTKMCGIGVHDFGGKDFVANDETSCGTYRSICQGGHGGKMAC